MRAGAVARAVTGVAVLMLAAGCSAIPTGSAPEVIKVIAPAGSPLTSPPPVRPNANPRDVVSYFLDGNANVNDTQHAAATSVLVNNSSWVATPTGVTVVNGLQVGIPKSTATTSTVTVSGQQIGTLDASGRYSPTLNGDGTALYSKEFVLKRVAVRGSANPQWRISQAPKGIVLRVDQFNATYRQRELYFFDSTYPAPTTRLIPQTRYSPQLDPNDLAKWLVDGLVADPGNTALNSGLQVPDQAPGQSSTAQVTLTFPSARAPDGAPVKIEVPRSRVLDENSKNALAAELGATLAQIPTISMLQITDGGAPVRIPAVASSTFAPGAPEVVGRYQASAPTASTLCYVYDGAVLTASGTRVKLSPLPASATGGRILSSAALHPTANGTAFDVAAVYGTNDNRLAIGPQSKLKSVQISGRMSRPSWQPDGRYAWIGVGGDLWRVSRSGQAVKASIDNLAGGQVLTAVRVSPDGGRIALVVTSTDKSASQVYTGTIQSSPPQIVDLQAITPNGLYVTDVAWYDPLQLFVIGSPTSIPTEYVFYQVQNDGSLLTSRQTDGLPGAPESLTVADGSLAVVAVGGTLWRQTDQGESWERLRPDSGFATNPIYIE